MSEFRGHVVQRVIIYPAYIDVKKTVAQGRRVSKSKGTMAPPCCWCTVRPFTQYYADT